MKKFLIIVLIIAFLGGVGFLGFLIFRSKNIVNVELEGQIQTLYFASAETVSPNFQDAKIKVTYRNGDVKYVDPNKTSVKINDFSTSIERHGTMKITYKSGTLSVDYNVIKKGMYYLRSEQVLRSGESDKNPQKHINENIVNSDIIFYIGDEGKFQFFKKDSVTGRWILNDSKYNENYSYSIVGDTLSVNFVLDNGNQETYKIKAEYKNGEIIPTSVNTFFGDNGVETMKIIREFKNYGAPILENNNPIKVTHDAKTKVVNRTECIVLKKNSSIDKYEIYLNIEFTYPIIDFEVVDEATGQKKSMQMLKNVYVKLTSNMVDRLYTDELVSNPSTFYVNYLDLVKDLQIHYIVEE